MRIGPLGEIMTVVQFVQSMSVETIALLLGFTVLLLIIVILHTRNLRWVRSMASKEETSATKARMEKLLEAVERLSKTRSQSAALRNRPLNKGTKRVPAIRSAVKTAARRGR